MPDYSLIINVTSPRIRLKEFNIALKFLSEEAKIEDEIIPLMSEKQDSVGYYISSGLNYDLFQDIIEKHLGKFKKHGLSYKLEKVNESISRLF